MRGRSLLFLFTVAVLCGSIGECTSAASAKKSSLSSNDTSNATNFWSFRNLHECYELESSGFPKEIEVGESLEFRVTFTNNGSPGCEAIKTFGMGYSSFYVSIASRNDVGTANLVERKAGESYEFSTKMSSSGTFQVVVEFLFHSFYGSLADPEANCKKFRSSHPELADMGHDDHDHTFEAAKCFSDYSAFRNRWPNGQVRGSPFFVTVHQRTTSIQKPFCTVQDFAYLPGTWANYSSSSEAIRTLYELTHSGTKGEQYYNARDALTYQPYNCRLDNSVHTILTKLKGSLRAGFSREQSPIVWINFIGDSNTLYLFRGLCGLLRAVMGDEKLASPHGRSISVCWTARHGRMIVLTRIGVITHVKPGDRFNCDASTDITPAGTYSNASIGSPYDLCGNYLNLTLAALKAELCHSAPLHELENFDPDRVPLCRPGSPLRGDMRPNYSVVSFGSHSPHTEAGEYASFMRCIWHKDCFPPDLRVVLASTTAVLGSHIPEKFGRQYTVRNNERIASRVKVLLEQWQKAQRNNVAVFDRFMPSYSSITERIHKGDAVHKNGLKGSYYSAEAKLFLSMLLVWEEQGNAMWQQSPSYDYLNVQPRFLWLPPDMNPTREMTRVP